MYESTEFPFSPSRCVPIREERTSQVGFGKSGRRVGEAAFTTGGALTAWSNWSTCVKCLQLSVVSSAVFLTVSEWPLRCAVRPTPTTPIFRLIKHLPGPINFAYPCNYPWTLTWWRTACPWIRRSQRWRSRKMQTLIRKVRETGVVEKYPNRREITWRREFLDRQDLITFHHDISNSLDRLSLLQCFSLEMLFLLPHIFKISVSGDVEMDD